MAFLRDLFGKAEKEEASKSEVVLFLIPARKYKTELLDIIGDISKNCSKIIYISLNRPAENVIEIIKEANIDAAKFLFVDAITKEAEPTATDSGIMFLDPPQDFKKFESQLSMIIEKEKFSCMIFDSLSTLLLYQDENTVSKFTHDLIVKLMTAHANGEFICLSEDIKSTLLKDISMFVDKIVDMRDEGEKKRDVFKKRENIPELQKRLDSVRQAYESNLISEQSYLKAKERIEAKLKKCLK